MNRQNEKPELSVMFSSSIRNENDLMRTIETLRGTYESMPVEDRYRELISAKDALYGPSSESTDGNVAMQCGSEDISEKYDYLLSMMQATGSELFAGTAIAERCQKLLADNDDSITALALFTIMARQEKARNMAGTHPSPKALQ